MDGRRTFGVALVVVAAFGFGSGAIFAKPVYATGVDWIVLSAYRFLFGASLSWAWLLLWPARRHALLRLDRRTALVSLALGILYIGNSGTYFAALETLPASLAALIVYIYPAIVAVLSLRIGRRLEGRRAWFALATALVGATLTVGGIETGEPPPLGGIVLALASPLVYSVWIVLAARLAGERRHAYGDESTSGAAAAVATTLMMTATAAAYWVGALALDRPVLPAQVPAEAWFGLAGVGIMSTFIAIQTLYAGAQRIGAARAALVSTVEPVWTVALATLLLGERLAPVQLAGGALIVLGVIISQTGRAVAAPAGRPAVAPEP